MYGVTGVSGAVHLEKVGYQVVLHEVYFATTVTILEYHNTNNKAQELEFQVPTSKYGAIQKLKCDLVDPDGTVRTKIARIMEKEKADEMFDDGVAQGSTVMTMGRKEDDPAKTVLNLGNILPKTKIILTLQQVDELQPKFDAKNEIVFIRYELESHWGKCAQKTKLTARVKEKMGSYSVKEVAGNRDFSNSKNQNGFITKYVNNVFQKSSDLTIDIKLDKFPTCEWLYHEKTNGFFGHIISIFPPLIYHSQKRVPLVEIVVIIDRSGSMSGNRIRYAAQALKLLLLSLDVENKPLFNIISFGSDFKSLFEESVLYNEKNFQIAMKHVSEIKADMGGTDIYSPLKNTLSKIKPKGYQKRIAVLLTDGQASNETKILNLLQEKSDSLGKEMTKVFCLGIGNGVNRNFLSSVANISGGTSEFINRNEVIECAVMSQLDEIYVPQISNVKVEFFDGDGSIFNVNSKGRTQKKDEHICKYYFSEKVNSKMKAKVSFVYGDEKREVEVKPTKSSDGNISLICARKRIDYLEAEMKGSSEIFNLGFTFSILSSKTSFILVFENEYKEPITSEIEKKCIEILDSFKVELKELDEKREKIDKIVFDTTEKEKSMADTLRDLMPSIDDYQELKVIGRGSFGTGLQVKKKSTGEIFYMKSIKSPGGFEMDMGEFIQKLSHPFLTRVYQVIPVPEKDKMYIISEFLHGGELFFHLKEERKFLEDKARFYFASVVLALEHIHKANVIYRDLKPENIVLDQKGFPRLTGVVEMNVKRHQMFCGTPEYLINEMYELILKEELKFPKDVSEQAKSLITSLLEREPRKRMDIGEAKKHKFFEGFEFDKLEKKSLKPPFVPRFGCDDSAYFEPEFTSPRLPKPDPRKMLLQKYIPNQSFFDSGDFSLGKESGFVEHTMAEKNVNVSFSAFGTQTSRKSLGVEKKKNFGVGPDVIDNIKLNDLLFCVQFDGTWKFTSELVKMINLTEDDVKKSLPKKSNLDLWVTAIILTIIMSLFDHYKIKWKFIEKKASKKLADGSCEDIMELAKKFLETLKMI